MLTVFGCQRRITEVIAGENIPIPENMTKNPDKAMEPKRLRSVFTVFVFSLIVWGVVTLIVAAVREHIE